VTLRAGELTYWDAESGELLQRRAGVQGQSLSWSPTGACLATFSQDAQHNLWLLDSKTGRVQRELGPHPQGVWTIAWSPDGARLATGGPDKTIRVWDILGDQSPRVLTGHEGALIGLAWSPDGRELASTSHDRTLRRWDVESGELRQTYRDFPKPPPNGPLLWCSNGRRLLVSFGGDQFAELNLATDAWGTCEGGAVGGHRGDRIVSSPDGRLQAFYWTGGLFLRDAETGERRTLMIDSGQPEWCADSRRLLYGWAGSYAYDAIAELRLGVLLPYISGGQYACIGPDGNYRGSKRIDEHLVYVAMLEDGSQVTYSPAEFREKFGWKNDPSKARLLKLDPEPPPSTAPLHEGLNIEPVARAPQVDIPPQPIRVKRGGPLSSTAIVTEPIPIPGLRSWSVQFAGLNERAGAGLVSCSPNGELIALTTGTLD